MIRLQTLGSLDLRAAEGAAFQPVLRQSKRLALLAYLAIEKPGHFHRRDQLLGLFWPEADLRGGRASLSQAVHFLRQYLGKDAIINRGDEEIGIGPEIWCDAAAFQQLIAAGRYAEAMELYQGELLPSFFVEQADGFEQWLEQKRDTLQREAMRTCVALADIAEQEDRPDDVVTCLRRAISYFPYDESLHRRLIAALDGAGDRAAALRAYDELVQTLRTEFEAEPSAETRELINAVRARTEAQPMGPLTSGVRSIGAAALLRPRTGHRRRYALALAASILVVAAVAWGAWSNRDEAPYQPPLTRVAVLFFNDASPNHELGYLADGLTSTLIDYLGQVGQIEVISENGVRPFRGDSIALDSIARQLDVGTIVGGTISRSGDQLRVTVQLVKGSTGVLANSETFNRPIGELFALLDDIAGEVGSHLRASIGEEIKLQRYQSETGSIPAWRAIHEAEKLMADGKLALEQGQVAAGRALFDRADSLLQQAAQLDKDWAAPLVLQASLSEQRAWQALMGGKPTPREHLQVALQKADQALQRDERSASAYETRGRVRFVEWMVGTHAPSEAEELLAQSEADLSRALSLDADRARAESTLSLLYEARGSFDMARQAAKRALAADAYLEDAQQVLVRLFQSSFELGEDDEAGQWCDEVRRRMSGKWPAAYCDLVLLGWRDQSNDARKALYILENLGANDPPQVRAAMRPRLMVIAATTVARSGNVELAERMVQEARAAAPYDVELLHVEAALRVALQQYQQASHLLNKYFEQNPKARARVQNGRMFKPLRESLVAAQR